MQASMQEAPPKLHDWNIVPKKKHAIPQLCKLYEKNLSSKSLVIGPGPIKWTVSDLAKAGCLLSTPSRNVNFEDEQEMRVVYTLIYDVFRCELIEIVNH